VPSLLSRSPDVVKRALRVLAHVLGALGPNGGPLGASLALLLGEWVMRVPVKVLLTPDTPASLIVSVLSVLNDVSNGTYSHLPLPDNFEEELPTEWDNSVKVNDLRSPKKTSPLSEKTTTPLACRYKVYYIDHIMDK